jgi:hypothetical protein
LIVPNRLLETSSNVKVGQDDAEHDGSSGDSATQYAGSCRIAFGDTIVRLIDTPGVGDVRGIEADQKNLANILGTISRHDNLHGIINLLKPNSSRLSLMFRFCVKELLTNLHKDAGCVDLKDFAGVKRPIYKSHYHPACSLKHIDEDVVEHARISRCSAFGGHSHCRKCGHNWQEHMHIR